MNAISKVSVPSDRTLPDGSLVITPEQLARFGNGDAKRGRRELRLLLAMEKDRSIRSGPTPRPVSVRIAGPNDEQAVLDLLLLDLKENAERFAQVDPDSVMKHIQHGTRRQGGICGVIDGPDGKPVAVTILVPFQWWFSRAFYLMEICNYVHSDNRRSHHIDDLLNFQRWASDTWSKEYGYRVPLLCGVLGAARVKEKVLLYRRRFAQAGAAFLYPDPFEGGYR